LSRLSNDENGPERRGITRADLEQLPGSSLDGFVAEKFALARKAAEAFSPTLFTDANLGDGVSQGSLADCWLLAAAASRARQQPEALLQSFETLTDGRYRVSLPQRQTVEVDPPTAAEAAAFGSSGGGGHWLTVLEKAVAQAQSGFFQESPVQLTLTPRAASAGIVALTGDATDHDFFALTSLPATRAKLVQHLANRDLVVAGTGPDLLPGGLGPGMEAMGLVPGHCYAVLEYDSAEDKVLLQNPYGDTEWNAPADGVDDGKFWLSLEQMHRHFTDIAYQQR
jgi:hypothetical protein